MQGIMDIYRDMDRMSNWLEKYSYNAIEFGVLNSGGGGQNPLHS